MINGRMREKAINKGMRESDKWENERERAINGRMRESNK